MKITFNSPTVLGFTIACFIVMILDIATNSVSTYELFCVYRAPLTEPFTYIRFFGHVLGHAGWSHLIGNIMFILILGPLLEEKYGSKNILFVILTTALVTGIIQFIFFPDTRLLGASGVVFAFILLSSLTGNSKGEIPLTFILVALIYIGQQVYEGIFVNDNVSNLTHIIGGIVGSVLGIVMNRNNMNRFKS